MSNWLCKGRFSRAETLFLIMGIIEGFMRPVLVKYSTYNGSKSLPIHVWHSYTNFLHNTGCSIIH